MKRNYLIPASVLMSVLLIAAAWYAEPDGQTDSQAAALGTADTLEERVLPSGGVVLPVRWGDLGARMVEAGVIDAQKFASLYAGRGSLNEDEKRLLTSTRSGKLTITKDNAGYLLNLFWALGLGTKNDILETGPMRDPRYGNAGAFASTGGWTLAEGNAMDHYARHPFIVLTPEQQRLVERVSRNIYRPCCDNPTYFPDCNHGMAMLGLLELLASQGADEDEMYATALRVNAHWFPDTYVTIARYLASKGSDWEQADPRQILGADYSSASGYRRILDQVTSPIQGGGGGCGA